MIKNINVPFIQLETPRLVLRPMSESDAKLIVHWRNSQRISSMSLRTGHASLSLESHLDWFSKTRNLRVDYVISQKEPYQLIGGLSFVWQKLFDSKLCAEMGKYIGEPSALGKGYATEATIRWLQFAFQDIGVEFVFAVTRFDNAPNIRLNKKLGFEAQSWPNGLKRLSNDWIFMILTKHKFERFLSNLT